LLVLVALVSAVLATIPKGYVRVPGGKLAHQSCVKKVPNGSTVERLAGGGHRVVAPTGVALELAACPHGLLEPEHGAAWIVDAMQDNNADNGFSLFATNFTIPSPPTNPNVLLYYWPGTEDEVMGDVVQPVLQYGTNGQEGGSFWGYMSWYVSGDGTVLTGPFLSPLDPGTQLGGQVQISADGQSYVSLGNVGNQETSLAVTVSESSQQARAYLTVEIYEIDGDCTKVPPDNQLVFTDILMYDGSGKSVTPNMIKEVQPAQVCDHDVIPNGNTVTITWKST